MTYGRILIGVAMKIRPRAMKIIYYQICHNFTFNLYVLVFVFASLLDKTLKVIVELTHGGHGQGIRCLRVEYRITHNVSVIVIIQYLLGPLGLIRYANYGLQSLSLLYS